MTSSHSLLKGCIILQFLGIIGWIVVIIARIKIIFICFWGQVYILHHLYLAGSGGGQPRALFFIGRACETQ